MFRIAKRFEFAASHQLDHLPLGHPCCRMHGHNYTVEIVLEALNLNEYDMVVDYRDLEPLDQYLKERWDHRHLNDHLLRPTAERIAKELFCWCRSQWPATKAVRVSETGKTWAEYGE